MIGMHDFVRFHRGTASAVPSREGLEGSNEFGPMAPTN
jgi:hypothetical protein